MTMLLIGGLWMPPQVWDATIAELTDRGTSAVAVALPGQGDGNAVASLDDQLDAVLAAVDGAAAAGEKPVVVGHSAACTLAWLAADRRPDAVAALALVGGMPTVAGQAYAEFFPVVDGAMAFPGWEPFAGPDSGDLDEAAKAQLAAVAVPVPGGVASAVVQYQDERRFAVPVTMVCPEFTPDDVQAWIGAGQIPELAAAQRVSYIDIATGHWPMVSAPDVLADALQAVGTGE